MDCQLVRAVPGESVANEPVASAGGHSEQSFQPVRYLRQRAVVREPWAGVVRSRIQFIYVLSEVYFGGKQRGAAVWRAQREIRMGLPEYEGRRRGTEQFLHAAGGADAPGQSGPSAEQLQRVVRAGRLEGRTETHDQRGFAVGL